MERDVIGNRMRKGHRGLLRGALWSGIVSLLLGIVAPVYAQEVLNVPGVVYRPQERQADPGAVVGPRHPAPALEAAVGVVLGEMPPLQRQPGNERIGQPMQVGVHRGVETPVISGADLQWSDAVGGGLAALVGVRSSGAEGLRIAVRFEAVPEGAELRFYPPGAPGAPEVFGPGDLSQGDSIAGERAAGSPGEAAEEAGSFWSPAVAGEAMLMEIWLPAGAPLDGLALTVEEVAHLYGDIFGTAGPAAPDGNTGAKDLSGVGASSSCNRDIACDPRWQTTADSVAKYLFAKDGGSFLCTGQLLTDVEHSFTPYFLTAAHCISSRRAARSMTFFWFFQRAACDGDDPTEVVQTASGARLLVTTGPTGEGKLSTDHALVRIKRRRELPDGVAFSGWSTRDADRLEHRRVEGIHHPSGDVKMGSVGKGQGLVQVDEFGRPVDAVPATHYELVWRKGTTEGGSSGSGIWFGRRWPNQYLMGVLTGGFASCSAPREPDYYGRFDKTFAEEPRLRKFLTGKRKR